MNTPEDKQSKEIKENECSDTWIYSQELEDLPWQQSSLGEYKQLSLWRSTPTLNSSCDRTSQEFQFTLISKISTQSQESLKSLPAVFPAREHQTQELERDSNIQLHLFGEKDLDVLSKLNPASVLSNNEHPFVPQHKLWEHLRCSKELSNEDFELFLADSLWQDTQQKLAMSRQQSLGRVIKGSDYLSFPTLTSNARGTSANLRFAQIQGIWEKQSFSAGQTKCEKWFKDNGLIPSGSQLGTQAIALTMGFPSNWFEDLTEQYSKNQTTPSQIKPQAESEPDISQDEPLHQHKQPSPSAESSISTVLLGGDEKLLEHKGGERSSLNQKISIPCLVKQPKQPEVEGVIKEDLGDRFLVDISDETISISKLFVYPDFSKIVGQIPPTKQVAPPSKTRRKKGDGTGYIYRRTVTRRGKQYQESYFRYRDESGKLKAKYIPHRLLCKVEEAESAKNKIADILFLLGGDEISRGEHSSTLNNECVRRKASPLGQNIEKSDELISISRGEQLTPPSNRKRKKGEGTGYIECKPIKRSGKEYKQYWYHYEEWREGDRLLKKSRYIPKRLVARVEQMEAEKVSVRKILDVLISRDKRS